MTRDQDLLVGLARQIAFRVGKTPRLERGVDANGVGAIRQTVEPLVLHAESPSLSVVGGPVRDHIRLVRQSVNVLFELGQGHRRIDGSAIAHHMEVVVPEVDDSPSMRIFDIGVPDVPLEGDGPIEHLRARWDLVHIQGDTFPDAAQRFTDTVACDTAADRVELFGETQHLVAGRARIDVDPKVSHPGYPLPGGSFEDPPTNVGAGIGTMNVPPASRYARCCFNTSSLKFQLSKST